MSRAPRRSPFGNLTVEPGALSGARVPVPMSARSVIRGTNEAPAARTLPL